MRWVVVGGQSRSVGKTAVVCGLLAALDDRPWTAVKITQFGHGICSRSGHACDCACEDGEWALSEERNHAGRKDTARYLRAGARRVWWLRTRLGALAQALPALESQLGAADWVLFESNSVVALRRPELYLTLLDPAIADFKQSARALLPRADARLVVTADPVTPASADDAPTLAGQGDAAPVFAVAPPAYLTPAVVAWARRRLAAG
ncbi:MAG: hypothetical protein ACRD2E_08495 [Terriglobales bacterium]